MATSVLSTESDGFVEPILSRLRAGAELLSLHRLPRAAGRTDWYFIRTEADLRRLLSIGKARSSFSVFLQEQLPIRGVSGPTLEDEALRCVDGSGEVLIVAVRPAGQLLPSLHTDDRADIREWFADHVGETLALGSPRFWEENGPNVVTAYVPDEDGVVMPDAY